MQYMYSHLQQQGLNTKFFLLRNGCIQMPKILYMNDNNRPVLFLLIIFFFIIIIWNNLELFMRKSCPTIYTCDSI